MNKDKWIQHRTSIIAKAVGIEESAEKCAILKRLIINTIDVYEHNRREWAWDEAMAHIYKRKDEQGRTQF